MLQRLRDAQLKINAKKCNFCRTELKYLGHVVTSHGVWTDPEKVQAIDEIPRPTIRKDLRRFLEMVSCYRKFIPRFSDIAASLTRLLQERKKWSWGTEETEAFEMLRQQQATAPVLDCPDFDQSFTLQTDASYDGL